MEPLAALTAPRFPPAFDAVAVGRSDAFRSALEAAQGGAGAGTLVFAQHPDFFDVAVVFEPEMVLRQSWPAALVTMLAISNALGALGPDNIPVNFTWPDRVEVNGGLVGGVRVAAAPGTGEDAVPAWLVAGVTLRMRYPETVDAPGRQPDRTALHEEGFGEVGAGELLESFAHHLLYWVHQWVEVGPEAVAVHWLSHLAPEAGGGARLGLDPATGDLLRQVSGTLEREALARALAAPSWSLDLPDESHVGDA